MNISIENKNNSSDQGQPILVLSYQETVDLVKLPAPNQAMSIFELETFTSLVSNLTKKTQHFLSYFSPNCS